MAAGAGIFLGNLATTGPLGRVRTRTLVAAGTVAQGVLFGAVFAFPLATAVAAGLLPPAAFGSGMAFVAVTALLVEELPGGAATTMVLNGSVFNLGTAAGAALGGLLIAVSGYGALGVGLPAFALAAGLLAPASDPSVGIPMRHEQSNPGRRG